MIHHDPADEPPADPIRQGVENRIVVGVDGSETSKRALAWSVDEASAWRAQVIAVHMWMPPYVEAELVPPAAYETAEYERLGSETLDSAIDAVDTSGLATPVDRLVVSGTPQRATCRCRRRRSPGRRLTWSRRIQGLLLGSISHCGQPRVARLW